MAKAKGTLGIKPLANTRGVLHVKWDKRRGFIAQAWPRKRGPPTNPKVIERRDAFIRAVRWVSLATDDLINAAREGVVGTSFTWKDVLMKCALGTGYTIVDETGSLWQGWIVAFSEIQGLLNALTNIPGCLIFRSTNEWTVVLPPAAAGKHLVYVGAPNYVEWQNVPQPTLGVTMPGSFLQYAPPEAADWTMFGTNGTNPDVTDLADVGMRMRFTDNPATGDNVRMALRALPAERPFTWRVQMMGNASAERHHGYGICIYGTPVGASGRKIITWGIHNFDQGGVVGPPSLKCLEWTDETTFGSAVLVQPVVYPSHTFEIHITSNNYRTSAGQFSDQIDRFVPNTNYTGFIQPTHYGFYCFRNDVDPSAGPFTPIINIPYATTVF